MKKIRKRINWGLLKRNIRKQQSKMGNTRGMTNQRMTEPNEDEDVIEGNTIKSASDKWWRSNIWNISQMKTREMLTPKKTSRSNRLTSIRKRRGDIKKLLKLFWKHTTKDLLIWIIQGILQSKRLLKKIELTCATVFTATAAKSTPQNLVTITLYPGYIYPKSKKSNTIGS